MRLQREIVALIAELELLAVWAAGQEARQARLEVLAAAVEDDGRLRQARPNDRAQE